MFTVFCILIHLAILIYGIFCENGIFLASSVFFPPFIFIAIQKYISQKHRAFFYWQSVAHNILIFFMFSGFYVYRAPILLSIITLTLLLSIGYFCKRQKLLTLLTLPLLLGLIGILGLKVLPEYIDSPIYSWMLRRTYASKNVTFNNGLTKIFYVLDTYNKKNKTFKINNKRYRYYDAYKLFPLNDHQLIATHQLLGKALLFDTENKKIETILNKPTINGCIDTTNHKIYLGETYTPQASYLTVNTTTPYKEKSFLLPNPKNDFFNKLEDGIKDAFLIKNKLYLFTLRLRLFEIDTQSHQILKSKRLLPRPFFYFLDGTIDAKHKKAYFTNWYAIFLLDLKSFHIETFKITPSFKIKYCDKRQLLVVADPIRQGILFLNSKTLKTEKILKTGRVRALAFDPNLKLIFTGDYFKGNFEIYETTNGKKIYSCYVGPHIRAIHFDKTTESVYISSSLGIFKYDPTPFLKKQY